MTMKGVRVCGSTPESSDLHDVLRVDRPARARLPIEARERVRAPRESLGEDHLERHAAAGAEVHGFVDGAHAASTELPHDLVLSSDDAALHFPKTRFSIASARIRPGALYRIWMRVACEVSAW